MTRTIFCQKLQQDAEGLDQAPFPGELGQRVYENISKEAWQKWLVRQSFFISEYRMNTIHPKAREFLMEKLTNYFFAPKTEKK